jgi:hypothetical protein
MEVRAQLHVPAFLSTGKISPVSIGQEAWYTPDSGSYGKERNLFPLPGIEAQFPGYLPYS